MNCVKTVIFQKQEAIETATKIKNSNKRIAEKVLKEFIEMIEKLS